jgi:hypothetical protein
MSRISPSHRQAVAPVINIQSALRITPEFCKNVSIAILFGSEIIHIQALYNQTCVYIYIYIYAYSSQYRGDGRKKESRKMGLR